MNKFLIIGIGCIVIVGFGIFSFSGRDVQLVETPKVKVTALVSGVDVAFTSNGKTQTVSDTTSASQGDVVITNKTGKALIEGNHDVFVDTESRVVVDAISDEGSRVGIESGKLWARTKKALDKGEYFEIETSNARAAVRGTSFGVISSLGFSTFFVTEGEILVAFKTKDGVVLVYTQEKVPAGFKAIVDSTSIEVVPITINDIDAWFKEFNPHFNPTQKPVTVENKKPVVETNFDFTKPQETLPIETVGPLQAVSQSSDLRIDSVTPSSVTVPSTATLVSIKGLGFLKIKSLVVGKVTLSQFKIVNDTTIQFDASLAGLTPGVYDVSFINISNNIFVKSKALTIVRGVEEHKDTFDFNRTN